MKPDFEPMPLKKAQEDFTRSILIAALVLNDDQRARTARYLCLTREGLYKIMKRLGVE